MKEVKEKFISRIKIQGDNITVSTFVNDIVLLTVKEEHWSVLNGMGTLGGVFVN